MAYALLITVPRTFGWAGLGAAGPGLGLGLKFVPEFVLLGGDGGGGWDGKLALNDEGLGDGEAGAEDDPGDGLRA